MKKRWVTWAPCFFIHPQGDWVLIWALFWGLPRILKEVWANWTWGNWPSTVCGWPMEAEVGVPTSWLCLNLPDCWYYFTLVLKGEKKSQLYWGKYTACVIIVDTVSAVVNLHSVTPSLNLHLPFLIIFMYAEPTYFFHCVLTRHFELVETWLKSDEDPERNKALSDQFKD